MKQSLISRLLSDQIISELDFLGEKNRITRYSQILDYPVPLFVDRVPVCQNRGARSYFCGRLGETLTKVDHCTLFDQNYLLEGLTLIDSFLTYVPEGKLWILCLDSNSYGFLKKINNPRLELTLIQKEISIQEKFASYLKIRSYAEAIFTIKSEFVLFVLSKLNFLDWAIYVDADSVFMPDYNLRRIPSESQHVILSPHYRSDLSANGLHSGEFNAGYVGFRASEIGLSAVTWWRDKCAESCSVRGINDQYADQKYLEVVLKNWLKETHVTEIGLNYGTWSFTSTQVIRTIDSTILIQDQPILTFHFHSLRHSQFFTYLGIKRYGKVLNHSQIKRAIYYPYIRQLNSHRQLVSEILRDNPSVYKRVIPSGMTSRSFFRAIIRGDIALNAFIGRKK